MRLNTMPREDGFRMPGEFEQHGQCWMLWPYRSDIWRCGAVYAQEAFAQVANAIAEFEPVTVGVMPQYFEDARMKLNEPIRLVEMNYHDAWIRDTGPTFVVNDQGQVRGIDWEFNAWGGLNGGLYFPWDADDRIASRILEIERSHTYRTEGFVLEGGSIHVDGEGTLLTTKQCLLNTNRNPHMSQQAIEEKLMACLNINKIIWLDEGLFNDETNGHIDNICCFARPAEVILSWTDNPNHPSYTMCQKAYEVLSKETDARGRSLKIHKLELPQPVKMTEEQYRQIIKNSQTLTANPTDLLPASYVNFLIVNNGIILPIFGDAKDQKAIDLIQNIFPDRKIVAVPSREIILGGGNIHCITQQQPKGRTERDEQYACMAQAQIGL